MNFVDVRDVERGFSAVLERVAAGETFVIANSGTPVARLAPIHSPVSTSRIGFLAGRLTVPDDFDRIESEEIARFQ
jgi:antitoxin (DNA-binding transcriptional repressor) of toxin-antitoxin stability system